MNIPKLKYIMIKLFKDVLKKFESILNEIKKIEMIRQLEMDQTYEIPKEIEELEIKIVDIPEELNENLGSLTLKCRYFLKKIIRFWIREKT